MNHFESPENKLLGLFRSKENEAVFDPAQNKDSDFGQSSFCHYDRDWGACICQEGPRYSISGTHPTKTTGTPNQIFGRGTETYQKHLIPCGPKIAVSSEIEDGWRFCRGSSATHISSDRLIRSINYIFRLILNSKSLLLPSTFGRRKRWKGPFSFSSFLKSRKYDTTFSRQLSFPLLSRSWKVLIGIVNGLLTFGGYHRCRRFLEKIVVVNVILKTENIVLLACLF